MTLFVRGTVTDLEHNSGTMPLPDGQVLNWANYTANVGGQKVKIKVKPDGTCLPVPAEGDRVEVAVSVNLKATPHNMLAPFVLELIATDVVVLATEAELVEQRAERSLNSTTSRGKRTA